MRVRSAGDQFHALDGVERNLGGKHFALLIADGLAVDDETDLRVVAQRMEKAVGVGRHRAGAVGDGLGQAAAGIETRQLQEAAAVDVLMRRRIALHGCSGGLHIDGGDLRGNFERDIHCDGQRTLDIHILTRRREAIRRDPQPIGIVGDIVEAECSGVIGFRRLLIPCNGVTQLDSRIRNDGSRRIRHSAT